jgi:hypothetical protein
MGLDIMGIHGNTLGVELLQILWGVNEASSDFLVSFDSALSIHL